MSEFNKTTDLLIKARAFIERGWCKDAEAIDEVGNPVIPTDSRAVAWCMSGSLRATGTPIYESEIMDALIRIDVALEGECIDFFNDRQETVEPILAVFDRAIDY